MHYDSVQAEILQITRWFRGTGQIKCGGKQVILYNFDGGTGRGERMQHVSVKSFALTVY
jgi:hypothetical protein